VLAEPETAGSGHRSLLERTGDAAARAVVLRPDRAGARRALYAAIALVVAASVVLAATTESSRLSGSGLRLRPGWLAVALAAFAILQLMHAELWRRVLASLGETLPARRARAIWCTSILSRYVPTSLLMPVVRVALTDREGVAKRTCLVSVVYEMALALTGALVMGTYLAVQLPRFEGHATRWLVVAVPVAAVVCLHPRIFHRLTDFALRRFGREPLPMSIPAPRLAVFVLLYAATFAFGGLALFALVDALHPVGAADLVTVAGAFAVGYAVSVLAFVLPGGLGAREAGIAVALAPVLPTTAAIAVAVAVRVLQIAVELVLAVVTPLAAAREARR
jgi:hypothetical protein